MENIEKIEFFIFFLNYQETNTKREVKMEKKEEKKRNGGKRGVLYTKRRKREMGAGGGGGLVGTVKEMKGGYVLKYNWFGGICGE